MVTVYHVRHFSFQLSEVVSQPILDLQIDWWYYDHYLMIYSMMIESMLISYFRPIIDLLLRRIVRNVVNIFGVSANPSVIRLSSYYPSLPIGFYHHQQYHQQYFHQQCLHQRGRSTKWQQLLFCRKGHFHCHQYTISISISISIVLNHDHTR